MELRNRESITISLLVFLIDPAIRFALSSESLRRQKCKVAVGSYPPRKGPGAPARTGELSAVLLAAPISGEEKAGGRAHSCWMPCRLSALPPALLSSTRDHVEDSRSSQTGVGCLPLSLVVMMSVCSYIERARSAAVMSAVCRGSG